jgi:hypothetical protein
MTTRIVMATEQGAQHASFDMVKTLCGIRISDTWLFEHESTTRGMSLRKWAGVGDSCARCLKKENNK